MDTSLEIIIRLILGALLGGIIGLEREVHGRSAGLRTQLIVCVAAVLIMIVSENYHLYLEHINPALRIDPARIASGAVIGVGFIGAGVIIKSGFTIRGLTTAAAIWVVSAIGLAIGAGLYVEGISTFLITIIALIILRRLERNLRTLHFKVITVTTDRQKDADKEIASVLSEHGINILSMDMEVDRSAEESTFIYTVSTEKKEAVRDAFLRLGDMGFVRRLKVDSQDRFSV
jgi:putative Mg2+ transporter-C (MgtC) family protein